MKNQQKINKNALMALKNSILGKVNLFVMLLLIGFQCSVMAGNGYAPGDKASDFNLKNTDGKMFSLSSMEKAKGFIVIFTCNHCPFSQAYEDRIISLHKKFAAKGYPVIAINPNDAETEPEDSYENMVKRAADHQYPFPYLVDNTQEIAKKYGATRTPHVFILSKKAKDLVVEYVGAIDDNAYETDQVKNPYIENVVNELLAGKNVSVSNTKAIGCGIKWKK